MLRKSGYLGNNRALSGSDANWPVRKSAAGHRVRVLNRDQIFISSGSSTRSTFRPQEQTGENSLPKVKNRARGAAHKPKLSVSLFSTLFKSLSLPRLVDLLHRVQHGGVVLAAKLASDLGQRGLGQMLGEIHRDLSRKNDRVRVVLGLDLARRSPNCSHTAL